MSRFKQLWLSFYRQNRGFGMIEAAILLPLFLIITFGVMEFGNMYMNRYQVHDVAGAVADYLQANPGATMDTPNGGLTMFVENLGVGLKNTTSGGENQISSKIKIKSATSIMTEAQFNALCSGGDVQSWANPYLADADTTNDKNPYYIHVCYPYTYNNITPLSGLSGGALPATKTLKGKAIAYVNTNNGGGGGDNPNPPIVNVKCPAGQFMVGISNTSALCEYVVAGGGGGECSRIPGARLSDGTVVADRCSPMVTTAESYFLGTTQGYGDDPNIWMMLNKPAAEISGMVYSYLHTLTAYVHGGKSLDQDFLSQNNSMQPDQLNKIWLPADSYSMEGTGNPSAWTRLEGEEGLNPDHENSVHEKQGYEYLWSGAKFCENLTAHGHSDWVLPTVAELYIMYNNRTPIGGFSVGTAQKESELYNSIPRLKTALFSADSRNNVTTQEKRVSDVMVSFGNNKEPTSFAEGLIVSKPNNWLEIFNAPFWRASLNIPKDTAESGERLGSFGVRCVRQSNQ